VAGAFLVLILLAAACGRDEPVEDAEQNVRAVKGESGLADGGEPVRGGRLVYGLEAESTGGWCLPESTLAISGLMVRWAIYDPLFVLNSEGRVTPYLAKSVTPNEDFTTWTIGLREGVTFHDDTKLDATVLKNNIDAFRGQFPPRKPALWRFILQTITSVEVKDELTVEVKLSVPWAAFPSTIAGIGISATAQLEDPDTCPRNLIGTGPFELSSWRPNQELVAQRNPDYWQMAPDGKPYPYVDAIAFRPIPEAQQRLNAIDSGEINVMMTSTPDDISGTLLDMRNDDRINLLVSEDHAEVNYVMFNSRKAPFDDERMRRAVAMGLDREKINELVNGGFPTVADQPFPPGDMGYVDDPGFPQFDPVAARRLVDEYVSEGKDAAFDLTVSTEPTVLARAEVIQNQLEQVGIDIRIRSEEQGTLISDAIGGKYQAMTFRGFPGPEPDTKYNWWYEKSPVNFGGIVDPVINKALDDGRAEADPAKRAAIYENLSKQFASKVWNVWLNYTPWAVAESKDVHGILPPELPDGESKPFTGLSGGHPVHAMWIESN
jgi:peptide/nickel transport system substrate-binding protein